MFRIGLLTLRKVGKRLLIRLRDYSPAAPSISSRSPSAISSASPAPTIAGMPIERATIAEWPRAPPIFR